MRRPTISISQRKQTIAQHFAHARQYEIHATVQQQICNILSRHIINCCDISVLEIGAGQGQLTQNLLKQITTDDWHINELCKQHTSLLQSLIPNAHLHIGDAETLPFEADYFDLIISANSVQWFDNPLHIVALADRSLRTGGQLLFNTFTTNNFFQIKQLTGQGLSYPSRYQWQKELEQYHFTDVQIDTHRYELHFNNPYEVLKHIQHTGVSVNNTQTSNSFFRWNKSRLQQFTHNYQQLFSTEAGQVVLTYEALMISACK